MSSISIIDLLDETVINHGDKKAFCCESEEYTWNEVQSISNKIATEIIALEVYKMPVLIYMDRTPKSPITMMGVLKAGAFYTVLDVEQPLDRIEVILNQLNSKIVITDLAHKDEASKLAETCIVFENVQNIMENELLLANVKKRIVSQDLAYVLFTSGSTGIPKGVAVSHKNVMAYSEWFVDEFGIKESDTFGGQTAFYFSMSVSDIYACVRSGACLEIIPKKLFGFPIRVIEHIKEKHINIIYWVPSALGFIVNCDLFAFVDPPKLEKILFAGESMPCSKLNYWKRYIPDALFANLFGPTETTDICTFYVCDREYKDDEQLPIGNACKNCDVLILDENDMLVKNGEEGELCVRGDFVAYGYYNMPQKTREKFTNNPIEKSYRETIYRTGDLVKRNENGELLFCGRKDNQIKHKGYRVELGEIDTACISIEGIQECMAVYDETMDKIGIGYTAKQNMNDLIKQCITNKLPNYMIPEIIERIKKMPHNANGKIDRNEVAKSVFKK